MFSKILFMRMVARMATLSPPAFTFAIKLVAFIAAIIALPFVLASGFAAVTDFSKELVAVMVLVGLVVSIGLATIATSES